MGGRGRRRAEWPGRSQAGAPSRGSVDHAGSDPNSGGKSAAGLKQRRDRVSWMCFQGHSGCLVKTQVQRGSRGPVGPRERGRGPGEGPGGGGRKWRDFALAKASAPSHRKLLGSLPSYAVPLAWNAVLPPNYTLLIFQPQLTRQRLCPAFPAPPSPQTRPPAQPGEAPPLCT